MVERIVDDGNMVGMLSLRFPVRGVSQGGLFLGIGRSSEILTRTEDMSAESAKIVAHSLVVDLSSKAPSVSSSSTATFNQSINQSLIHSHLLDEQSGGVRWNRGGWFRGPVDSKSFLSVFSSLFSHQWPGGVDTRFHVMLCI